jgi:ferredoxin
MFKFQHVLNVTTGQRYYIDKATYQGDEDYDETPEGVNLFEIDLQPTDGNGAPICGLCLVICNDGAISITKNLDPTYCNIKQSDSVYRSETVPAFSEGTTIVLK